jgi:hypothetical protein
MMKKAMRIFLFCLAMTVVLTLGCAQSSVLDSPLQSQTAELSQTIGITDITIKYHRPRANGRKIWDGLVPYGKGEAEARGNTQRAHLRIRQTGGGFGSG